MHVHQHGGLAALYALSRGAQVPGMRFTKTHELDNLDLALALAWQLSEHGTAVSIRALASRIRDRVQKEYRGGMRNLMQSRDDEAVLRFAIDAVQNITDLLGIDPGVPFPVRQPASVELVDPPRCHLKPMRLAGEADARHWACQHCTHTKPLNLKP